MISRKKAQITLEYVTLVVMIIGALLASANYFKRGIQGRWKAAVDDLGDQYDPRVTNANIVHRMVANTETRVTTVNDPFGHWTMRNDNTNSIETKRGFSRVGAF